MSLVFNININYIYLLKVYYVFDVLLGIGGLREEDVYYFCFRRVSSLGMDCKYYEVGGVGLIGFLCFCLFCF